MDIEAIILTDEQAAAWRQAFRDEYDYYVSNELFDPSTGELFDMPPEWMVNGDPTDGPFDFNLNPSQWHWGG